MSAILDRHASAVYKIHRRVPGPACECCLEPLETSTPFVLRSALRTTIDGERAAIRPPKNAHLACVEKLLERELTEHDFEPVHRNYWVWEPTREVTFEGFTWLHVPELNITRNPRIPEMPPLSCWLHITPEAITSVKRSGLYWMLNIFSAKKIEPATGPTHLSIGVAKKEETHEVALLRASQVMLQFPPEGA